jgi:hypothetical protein
VLVEQGLVATGHSVDSPAVAVLVFAGQTVAVEEVTATPTP